MFQRDRDNPRRQAVLRHRKLWFLSLVLLLWGAPASAIDYMIQLQFYNGNKFNDNLDDGLQTISNLGNTSYVDENGDSQTYSSKNTLRTVGRSVNGATLSYLMGFDNHFPGIGLGYYFVGTTDMTFSMIEVDEDVGRSDRLTIESDYAVLRLEYYYKIPISKTFAFMPGSTIGIYPMTYTMYVQNSGSQQVVQTSDLGSLAVTFIGQLIYDWNDWFSITFGLGITMGLPSNEFQADNYYFVYRGDDLKLSNNSGDGATVNVSGIDFRLGAAFRW